MTPIEIIEKNLEVNRSDTPEMMNGYVFVSKLIKMTAGRYLYSQTMGADKKIDDQWKLKFFRGNAIAEYLSKGMIREVHYKHEFKGWKLAGSTDFAWEDENNVIFGEIKHLDELEEYHAAIAWAQLLLFAYMARIVDKPLHSWNDESKRVTPMGKEIILMQIYSTNQGVFYQERMYTEDLSIYATMIFALAEYKAKALLKAYQKDLDFDSLKSLPVKTNPGDFVNLIPSSFTKRDNYTKIL